VKGDHCHLFLAHRCRVHTLTEQVFRFCGSHRADSMWVHTTTTHF